MRNTKKEIAYEKCFLMSKALNNALSCLNMTYMLSYVAHKIIIPFAWNSSSMLICYLMLLTKLS